MKPRLLDLFCGAGGAAMGYHRAGFEVVGVDIKPQPRYPFEFRQHDALTFLKAMVEETPYGFGSFDAIHASPPCQAFTQLNARWRGKGTKADRNQDLLTPTLKILRVLGLPYVVENVIGARRAMSATLILHGGMFGLGVHRPRLFESNVLLLAPASELTKTPIGVYGDHPQEHHSPRYRNAGNYRKGEPGSASVSLINRARTLEEGREAMGIDWMEWDELREAIPPAYTELIGHQLMSHLKARSAA